MSQENNLSTYPEGWNEVIKSMDFLPDDETRNQFLSIFVTVLIMM
ncbi:hypothetical protein [Alkalibaculum sporogenes]|nr:hypothetical protein [Alkalibaculum sporogenes]